MSTWTRSPSSGLVALLAEGVDRNPLHLRTPGNERGVALLAEGVDRNFQGKYNYSRELSVALLAEGVDRNSDN